MRQVKPGGPKDEKVQDDRRSLQGSEWFVRSDLRSLSRTTNLVYSFKGGCADRERANKPSPVTPNIRAKLMASKDRARKNSTHDAEPDRDDAQLLEKSTSLPELKRWKPSTQSAIFEDVLSTYCNSTTISTSPFSRQMSQTLPAGFFGDRNSTTCWADGDSTPTSALSPDSSLRKSMMKHAAQGVVRRITLDAQSIC
jgi:hypothetical protein